MTGFDPEDFRSEFDGGFGEADARIRRMIEERAKPAVAGPDPAHRPYMMLSAEPDQLASYVAPSEVPQSRRSRWLAVAAAAVVVVVVASAVMIGSRSPSGTKDRAAIEELAQTAAGVVPVSGQSQVFVSVVATGDRTVRRVDVSADGKVSSTVVVAGASGEPPVGSRDPGASVAGFSSYEFANLPTDPEALVAAVESRTGQVRSSGQVVSVLAELSAMPFASAQLRSAAVEGIALAGAAPSDVSPGPIAPPGDVFSGPGWLVVIDPATGAASAFRQSSATGDVWTVWSQFDPT